MNKNKKLGFTLAEVLIVIGIIGVVAALTLPNLNHATGDKETVTRLQKAYSILNEANDRAVAIYGPISEWNLENDIFWMKRIGNFLKISKSCDETGNEEDGTYTSCDALGGEMSHSSVVYQLPDGIVVSLTGICGGSCDCTEGNFDDLCAGTDLYIDVNGPNKGKNEDGNDIFRFAISDKLGIVAPYNNLTSSCIKSNGSKADCSSWVLNYGNLDYLKVDENGKCNDSNIILDGTTNTSCH